MAEKRVQISVPETADKIISKLATDLDETKGKVVKIAVEAFAKKVGK